MSLGEDRSGWLSLLNRFRNKPLRKPELAEIAAEARLAPASSEQQQPPTPPIAPKASSTSTKRSKSRDLGSKLVASVEPMVETSRLPPRAPGRPARIRSYLPPCRDHLKMLNHWQTKEAARLLKALAAKLDVSQQMVIGEGINLVLAKHGLPPVAIGISAELPDYLIGKKSWQEEREEELRLRDERRGLAPVDAWDEEAETSPNVA